MDQLQRFRPPENQKKPDTYLAHIYEFGPEGKLPIEEWLKKDHEQTVLIVARLELIAKAGIEMSLSTPHMKHYSEKFYEVKQKRSHLRALGILQTVCGKESFVVLAMGNTKGGSGKRGNQELEGIANSRMGPALESIRERNEDFMTMSRRSKR